MEPEAKYTLVGTVVLILVGLIAVAVVWLKSTGGERDDHQYKIYFARQSLEGLQVRSDVKMKGIRIGSVVAFRISSRRPGTVEVTIRVDGSAPILQNTRADVERHLLTGLASIRLVNGKENGPPLTEAPPDEPYPVIAEGESEYQQLSESLTQMASRGDETLRRLNTTLSDQNQAALTDILANLRRITGRTDRALENLDKTLASMSRAADDVRAAAGDISGDVRKVAERYDKLGEESQAAVRDITLTIRQVGADVARLSNRADALVSDGSLELQLTARELRSAADSLGAAARRISDPGRVLFGPYEGNLGPGEAR